MDKNQKSKESLKNSEGKVYSKEINGSTLHDAAKSELKDEDTELHGINPILDTPGVVLKVSEEKGSYEPPTLKPLGEMVKITTQCISNGAT